MTRSQFLTVYHAAEEIVDDFDESLQHELYTYFHRLYPLLKSAYLNYGYDTDHHRVTIMGRFAEGWDVRDREYSDYIMHFEFKSIGELSRGLRALSVNVNLANAPR